MRNTDLSLIWRGMKELHRLTPWNLLAKCIRSICNAAIPFVSLYFSAEIITKLVSRSPFSDISYLVVITIVSNLVLVLISKWMDAINYCKWNEFYVRYNLSIGEKAQSLPFEKIEDYQTHLLIKNIDDAMKISNYGLIKLHSRIPLLVENFLKVLLSSGFILSAIIQKAAQPMSPMQRWMNSYLADGILITLVLISALISMQASKRISKRSYQLLGDLSKNNRINDFYLNHYLDNHNAAKDIRLYQQDQLILQEMNRADDKSNQFVASMNRTIANNQILVYLVNGILVLYTYLYIGIKAMSKVFAVGSIVKYSGGVLQFADSFSGTMDAISQLQANTKYLKDYFRFIDMPEAEEKKYTCSVIQDMTIQMNHLSFHYPEQQEDVLKDINLSLHPGERVAIVGPNGSGKTTLVKLLCRLYNPSKGEILIGGTQIQEISMEQYRELISVVFQDYKLFSFQLGQNVSASMDVSENKAVDALQEAGFGERLKRLPDGLDTYLYKNFDERGVEISGGEAQKIAIARALYRDTPIVVLDEPTAALDPIAEAEVFEELGKIASHKTAVFISHRFSSCKFCDQIIVLDQGKVVQQGSHDTLIQDQEGLYYQLWMSQAKYYK